jgi:hypothetical protein
MEHDGIFRRDQAAGLTLAIPQRIEVADTTAAFLLRRRCRI